MTTKAILWLCDRVPAVRKAVLEAANELYREDAMSVPVNQYPWLAASAAKDKLGEAMREKVSSFIDDLVRRKDS